MIMPQKSACLPLKFGSHLLHFTPFSFCVFYLDFPFFRDVTRYRMLCLIFYIWFSKNKR